MLADMSKRLTQKAVYVIAPEQTYMGSDVDVDRIEQEVVIYPGCRITGKHTYISRGARLGTEGPVVIDDCQIGPNAVLASGYFSNSVFLEGAKAGANAHVREATILEEETSFAHCVGLKHTVLLPFVMLGSVINFCDCLMAGGTSRKNHSEVGSSYIHFNYTAHQDKATPSLIGDVPSGVTLRQPPIFLGGQGGLVGPRKIAYGTVLAAGTICRKDIDIPDQLITMPESTTRIERAFRRGEYGNLTAVIANNITYIANLRALQAWYQEVRFRLISREYFPKALYEGLLMALEKMIQERIDRMAALHTAVSENEKSVQKNEHFYKQWPKMTSYLKESFPEMARAEKERFLTVFETELKRIGKISYPVFVSEINDEALILSREWLQVIIDTITSYYKTKLFS